MLSVLQKNLLELLKGGGAHLSPREALDGIQPSIRMVHPAPRMKSIWEIFEHMRLSQEDILRYTLDPSWVSPPWPDGVWPDRPDTIADSEWEYSVSRFNSDLDEMLKFISKGRVDLLSAIPHGEGRTYIREIMLMADHNSYHAGQIVIIRRMLDDWPSKTV